MTPSRESWESGITETVERIVIDYANFSGRESANRAAFRVEVEKHIRQLLLSKDAELAAEVEKMKRTEKCSCGAGENCGCEIRDYNYALDDVLKLINKGI